jgi:hypothetical protein
MGGWLPVGDGNTGAVETRKAVGGRGMVLLRAYEAVVPSGYKKGGRKQCQWKQGGRDGRGKRCFFSTVRGDGCWRSGSHNLTPFRQSVGGKDSRCGALGGRASKSQQTFDPVKN